MRFIQIANTVINLDQITSVEYNPYECHPSNPARFYSALTVNFIADEYQRFYEEQADALWRLIQTNATFNIGFPDRDSAITAVDSLENSFFHCPD